MRHAILLFRLVRSSCLGLFCWLAASSLLQAGVGDGFEPAATVPAAIETGAGSEGRSVGDRGDTRQDARPPSAAPEMVFISDDIIGFEMIAAAARPRHGVVILDHRRDGLAQIVDTLRGRPELGAIHLITHGATGKINLGTRLLDATALDRARDELSGVRRALGGRGDFLIYGCNVAEGAEGRGRGGEDAGRVSREAGALRRREKLGGETHAEKSITVKPGFEMAACNSALERRDETVIP